MEEEAAHRKISAVRSACARDMELESSSSSSRRSAAASFGRSLPLIRSRAEEEAALTHRENLRIIKEHLHNLEEDLQKALSVKSVKEEKHRTIGDLISTTKARIQELEKIVQDQKIRRDEYAAIITQQSLALEAIDKKSNQDDSERGNIDEAISWYHRVLGFQALGGDGVKFRFTKIDPKNSEEEFSFTIRLDGDKYILLQCDPFLPDISKLVEELNHTNGLYKFVRTVRRKFQLLVLNEIFPTKKDVYQDISTTLLSPPPPSADSRLASVEGELHADAEQPVKEQSSGKSIKMGCPAGHLKSPSSSVPLRRSTRFLGN